MSAKTATGGKSKATGTSKSSKKKPTGAKQGAAKKTGPQKSRAPKTAGKKAAPPKRVGAIKRWLPILILLVLVVGIGGMLTRDYQGRQMLDQIEQTIGPLEPEGVQLRVADRDSAQTLMDRLRGNVGNSMGMLTLDNEREQTGARTARLTYGGQQVDLNFYWEDNAKQAEPSGATEPVVGQSSRPRLALIIDDVGRSIVDLERILALPYLATPAILPGEVRSARAAALARQSGREYILHMPMEPQAYPEKDPGPGALLIELDQAQTRQRLADALAAIEGAAGVNNHMGSRATENEATMSWVMEELAARDLYFIDSLTTSQSVAADMAKHYGVAWAKRNIFIDNVAEVDEIKARIAQALESAKKRGSAIAIGHIYPETLQALEQSAEMIQQSGVELVAPSQLLNTPVGQTATGQTATGH